MPKRHSWMNTISEFYRWNIMLARFLEQWHKCLENVIKWENYLYGTGMDTHAMIQILDGTSGKIVAISAFWSI